MVHNIPLLRAAIHTHFHHGPHLSFFRTHCYLQTYYGFLIDFEINAIFSASERCCERFRKDSVNTCKICYELSKQSHDL